MANTKSAQKQWRVNIKKRLRNRGVRSEVRTEVTQARVALRGTVDVTEAASAVLEAVRALDIAAKKGVIKRNNAARRKSRLMLQLNKATAAAS